MQSDGSQCASVTVTSHRSANCLVSPYLLKKLFVMVLLKRKILHIPLELSLPFLLLFLFHQVLLCDQCVPRNKSSNYSHSSTVLVQNLNFVR